MSVAVACCFTAVAVVVAMVVAVMSSKCSLNARRAAPQRRAFEEPRGAAHATPSESYSAHPLS